jgi:hypothetical protein
LRRKVARPQPVDRLSSAADLWTLSLNIGHHSDSPIGTFTLYRRKQQPLLIDVNLLISDFATALSDSSLRVLAAEVGARVGPHGDKFRAKDKVPIAFEVHPRIDSTRLFKNGLD